MHPVPEDFEALLKLIALKQRELPSPGYFSRLPGKIAMRLEQGEGQPGFWEKFLAGYTFRPVFAYSFALAAFAALTFSVVYSVKTAPRQSAPELAGGGWRALTPNQAMGAEFSPAEPLHVANWMGNTNPAAPVAALPSLFGPAGRSPTVPVAYRASP